MDALDLSLSTFTASDGSNLAVYDWHRPTHRPVRAQILLVHGLGEHMGRYHRMAERLHEWGFSVRGYDHYGHGRSDGPRGGLDTQERLMVDLADVIDSTRARMPQGQALLLLGHSLGGLVCASLVASGLRRVEGLVLSSPALDAGLSVIQKMLVAALPRVLPNLRVGNGLDSRLLSHDAEVVAAYRDDPLVHDRIGGRLARFIAHEGPKVLAAAPSWSVPSLLLYAGADGLVNPAGSRAFVQRVPAQMLESHCFEGHYHEIFNEAPARADAVFETLRRWLTLYFSDAARAAPRRSGPRATAIPSSEGSSPGW